MIYVIFFIFSAYVFCNDERIEFESANPFSFEDIILYLEDQDIQNVYGILKFPEKHNKEKYPLIIGVAGSLGWKEHHHEFLQMYRDMGIATFQLQSFESRGIESTVGSQTEVTIAAIVLDSYRALDELSKNPKIDAAKVGITGWSLGGGVSLFAGWTPVIESIQPENKFAAHLPFYPPCFVKPSKLDFVDSPVHILIGELDDWTPANPCMQLIDDLHKTSNKYDNINITVYDGAHHSFDSKLPITTVPNGYSFKDCMFDLSDEGVPLMNRVNIPMRSPILQKIGFSFCVERGTTVGGNKNAREKSFEFSKLFMSKYLLEK
tara:strand:- start:1160 stop:2119 length:960 start_codon:yes stop_codon:yes gene_type:complete